MSNQEGTGNSDVSQAVKIMSNASKQDGCLCPDQLPIPRGAGVANVVSCQWLWWLATQLYKVLMMSGSGVGCSVDRS